MKNTQFVSPAKTILYLLMTYEICKGEGYIKCFKQKENENVVNYFKPRFGAFRRNPEPGVTSHTTNEAGLRCTDESHFACFANIPFR